MNGFLSLFSIPLLAAIMAFIHPHSHPEGPVDNDAFGQGEFLKYRIHYGLITAGFGELYVSDTLFDIRDKSCMHLVAKGYTNGSFDLFYKLRDQYESYMDTETLLAQRFNRSIQEGKYESYTETHFDHSQQKATYIARDKQETTYDVPPGIQDVISAFYFARATYNPKDMVPGDLISLRNFLDRKTFNLWARLEAREVIKVGKHKYQALRFDLLIEEAGLITDGSKIKFWISDDQNRIPLRIQSDLAIGNLKADLIEWKNLKHRFAAQFPH
ncbi:DUF3108 domain-containing protein [Pontibacter sp. G13]|uniref:DUF3108 domain-containing protein n=1 Tax=Pontibacter sp. G13 TaxID=3074898 RepID=UPI00288B0431|nr:DUF3108 domain-containing protein [Pontibacter sp. G13]WNJ20694.1 DUF3108 domain-containing protein [Pontibacter sp. G13]